MTSSGANSPSLLQATARATKLANMAKVKKDSLIVVSCLGFDKDPIPLSFNPHPLG
jgi:hypothetical protein